MLERYLLYLDGYGGWTNGIRVAIPYDALQKGAKKCFSWCCLFFFFLNKQRLTCRFIGHYLLRWTTCFKTITQLNLPRAPKLVRLVILSSIEYVVNSWKSYYNNYSSDYLKCQPPQGWLILNRLRPLEATLRKRDQILRALLNEKVATSVSHQNFVTFWKKSVWS